MTRARSLAVRSTLMALIMAAPAAYGTDIDRAAVDFQTPSDITWVRNAAGTNEQAVLSETRASRVRTSRASSGSPTT